MYGQSLLGLAPFELIWLLLGISVAGALAMLPIYFAFRQFGLSCDAAVFSAICFALLALFNLWCLYSASAAA